MFETERHVYHSCVGADGLMKMPVAADFLMDCCQFQERSESAFSEHMRQHDMAVFLASLQLDILRRPAFGEKVMVRVSIYDCKSIYGFRRITITDEVGQLCMRSNAIGAFFNFREGRAMKLPEAIRTTLTMEQIDDDMECLPRKIIIPDTSFDALDAVEVRPSRVDGNGHLTSTEYLAIAEDRLPDGFTYDQVRAEYKLQATPGSMVQPNFYHINEHTKMFNIVNQEGRTHVAVEFSKVIM